jgi:hypothetical protein
MKRTDENIKILRKMGFTCDFDRTKNPLDKDWFSLKNGWGFRLDGIRNFKHLVSRLTKAESEKE